MRRSRSVQGFSLLEVTIALAVLGVGLLAMLVLQVYSLQDGSRGRHTTAAAMIGRDQLERIQRMPFSSADLAVVGWTTPPWLGNGADPSLDPGEVPVRVAQPGATATEKVYTVWYRVIADAGGNTSLRNVDLEVTWEEDRITNNRPTRTGRPTVALSTILVDNDR